VVLAGVASIDACSAAAPSQGQDAATDTATPDASSPKGTDASTNTPMGASIVLVDQILDSTMLLADDAGAVVFDDVRVCVFDASNQPLTTYAMPDDAPMPFTNYPGVSRGRGADLGSFPVGAVTIDVFSAADLQADATWAQSRSSYTCAAIACAQGGTCRQFGSFDVTLAEGVNVLALGDDATSGHVKIAQAAFADVPFAGAPGELFGTVVNFSGWHDGNEVRALYGDWLNETGTPTTLADPLAPHSAASPQKIATLTTYDDLGLRFDEISGGQPFDHFGQSLDSIAFVSNPNVDPITFYAVRDNFVFALVGDPNDPTSVLQDDGRDVSFDGRGLHVVAIPYATPAFSSADP